MNTYYDETFTGYCSFFDIHYSKKLKEHVDIMIFIERYPLKRCQVCVKLIASKVIFLLCHFAFEKEPARFET